MIDCNSQIDLHLHRSLSKARKLQRGFVRKQHKPVRWYCNSWAIAHCIAHNRPSRWPWAVALLLTHDKPIDYDCCVSVKEGREQFRRITGRSVWWWDVSFIISRKAWHSICFAGQRETKKAQSSIPKSRLHDGRSLLPCILIKDYVPSMTSKRVRFNGKF